MNEFAVMRRMVDGLVWRTNQVGMIGESIMPFGQNPRWKLMTFSVP